MNNLLIKSSLFRSYIHTAIRTFRKSLYITLLNTIGLVLGISSFIFISLYVFNEMSFDRHVKDGDLIYRATFSWRSLADSEPIDLSLSVSSLPEQLSLYFPEVDAVTGIARLPKTVIEMGAKIFQEKNIFETDTSFFNVFQPEILAGQIQNSIGPSSIVLTESLAAKYFGNEDPLQQNILVNGSPYQVVAIIKDTPITSSLRYDALLFTFSDYSTDWCFTFFKIYPGTIEENLQNRINDVLLEEHGSYFSRVNATGSYELEKLHNIHFGKAKLYDSPKGNKMMIYILITIALLILVISVVNYLNLNIAQVSGRQIEVGMRKIFGASATQAVFQHVLEFFLIAVFCLITSVFFIVLLFDTTNVKSMLQINLSTTNMVFVVLFLMAILLVLSIFAGGYIYLQSNNPLLDNLRQRSGFKGNPLFRQSLLGFQFTISIALIFMAFIIMKQVYLMVENVSSLNVNQVMVIDLPEGQNLEIENFYNVLRQVPYIKSFSTVGNNSLPTTAPDFDVFAINVNGQPKINTYPFLQVDENFFDVLGIPILMGRSFSENDFNDKWDSPIVNEAFVKSQGWEDPLDHKITHFDSEEHGDGRIIGVVPDFPFQGFKQKNQPMIFYPNRGGFEKLMVLFSSLNKNGIEEMKQLWQSEMKMPMEFHFLDDYFLKIIEKEENLQWLLFSFSIVCLIIAGLGLFGIINISVTYHQREIAIRKAFGARLSDLVVSTWKEYAFIFLISAMLAYPIGLISLNKWLESFSAKPNLSIVLYIEAIAVVGLMMIMIMIYHSIKISQSKTIKWLRNE